MKESSLRFKRECKQYCQYSIASQRSISVSTKFGTLDGGVSALSWEARLRYVALQDLVPAPFIIIIVYYAKRQQHTIKYTKNTKKTQTTSKLRVCSEAHSKECHINTDSNDIANALYTTGLTATLYKITSYLEPIATNVLFFNADKVLSTTLLE